MSGQESTVSPDRLDEVTAALMALLPATLRELDAKMVGALEALIRVLAQGSAEIDQVIDALDDSLFVETAPEAALPALAALVAMPALPPLPEGAGWSPRALIADMIRIRRGKGTARALAELARDVTGEAVVVVECYQRLARLAHLIDLRPERPALAQLGPGGTGQAMGRAFDKSPRLVNVRSIVRAAGRHHIPHVGLHFAAPLVPVFPAPDTSGVDGMAIPAAQLAGCQPFRPWLIGGVKKPGYWQLAPRPRGILRLFNPDRTEDRRSDALPESLIPDRLRRLALHQETEELRQAGLEGRPPRLANPPWFEARGAPFTLYLRRAGEATFTQVLPQEIVISNLEQDPANPANRTAAERLHSWRVSEGGAVVQKQGKSPILVGFDLVTGRAILPAPAGAEVEELRAAYGYGIVQPMGAGAQRRNAAGVPFDLRDRPGVAHLVRVVDPLLGTSGAPGDQVRTVADLATALVDWAANGAKRLGVIVLARSDRVERAEITVTMPAASELHILAGSFRKPKPPAGAAADPLRLGYVLRQASTYVIDAPVKLVRKAPPAPDEAAGVLVLDGLHLLQGLKLNQACVSRLWLRHCTLRKPGLVALNTTQGLAGAEVDLTDCLSGPLDLDPPVNGAGTGSLHLTNSIVSADGAAAPAIMAQSLTADFCAVTLLGEVHVKSIDATNVIFAGGLQVRQRQQGCLRYSTVPSGSSTPRRFQCQPDLALAAAAKAKAAALTPQEAADVALSLQPVFLDTDLEEPSLAMLHPLCPAGIRQGGEGGTEMGAFARTGRPIRRSNLASLLDEFLPFGLEAASLDDLTSMALERNRSRP